jgi:hypothetical protein
MKERAIDLGSESFASSLEEIINEYFAMAKIQADIGKLPSHQSEAGRVGPVSQTISSLAGAVGASADDFWRLLQPWIPHEYEAAGRMTFEMPQSWTERQRLGFGCALFCVAWEHLRNVQGARAETILSNALITLL